MPKFNYDLIVIGAGSGGISAANLANGLGKKVALVEKSRIGGDCTWFGCVPSKALLNAAKIGHNAKNIEKFGMKFIGDATLNTGNVMEYVRSLRLRIYEREKPEVWQKKGIDVFIAPAIFLDNHHIRVNDRTISAKKFIIATGSRPSIPSIEGLMNVPYITDEKVFELSSLPESMVVLGGGPIGVETSSAFVRLGVNVTLIHRHELILPRDEPEMASLLSARLQSEGLKILSETNAVKFHQKGHTTFVLIKDKSGKVSELETDSVLAATGREVNTEGLSLEKAGVRFTNQGIQTDNTLRTSAENIYAVGDVLGGYEFSHIAEYQAVIAVKNAMLPFPIKEKVDYEHIVWATFTNPELAHSGLTEAQARKKFGDAVKVYRLDYNDIDRAVIDGNNVGFAKFIIGKGGRLLGIHILGERASEILHEAQVLKVLNIPFQKIAPMVHIYPSYGDLIKRPAIRYAVDRLLENPFVKLLRMLK